MGSKVAVLSSSFSSFGSSALVLSSTTTTGATASAAGGSIGVSSVDMFVGRVNCGILSIQWCFDRADSSGIDEVVAGRSLRCCFRFRLLSSLLLESFLDQQQQQQGYFDFVGGSCLRGD